MQQQDKNKKTEEEQHKDAVVQPDPETEHSTDPQDSMKGPVSSLVQTVNENADDTDEEAEKTDSKKTDE